MNASIAIPASDALFEGHFPDQPILPGVALLTLVLDTLAGKIQNPVCLRGIVFTRLRQLVLPGDCLDLATRELGNGHTRFDLRREGALVANGELILGHPDKPCPLLAEFASMTGHVDAPPLDTLLPQRPPMRLLTAILSATAHGLSCAASIPSACALVRDGSAPALVGLEAAAQTAAAWESMRRWRAGDDTAPRIGYLVALRDVVFFAERVQADQALSASVRLEATAPPLTYYQVEVSLDDSPILRDAIATFLAAGG